jgi:hypothetical protein
MQEYEGVLRSDDDPELHNAPSIAQWVSLVDEASTKVGQKLKVAGDMKQHIVDAGFVDVRDDIYKVCAVTILEFLTGSPDANPRSQVVVGHKIQS